MVLDARCVVQGITDDRGSGGAEHDPDGPAAEERMPVIDGERLLVAVPIEFPHGQTWGGVFGERQRRLQGLVRRGERAPARAGRVLTDAEINDRLLEVRTAQQELRYDDALSALDEILRADPLHHTALVLRDAVQTNKMYRDYIGVAREKELSYSTITRDNRTALHGRERAFADAPGFDVSEALAAGRKGVTLDSSAAAGSEGLGVVVLRDDLARAEEEREDEENGRGRVSHGVGLPRAGEGPLSCRARNRTPSTV